ncbi:hypothetical protein ANCCAN_06906 [Ancylostoma caninum]|uniref:Uncharacterized protein n=1 Tax=Ancylostoma caninum TaxID=29170 RepID=A0A368GVQ5_ANCCA|nr:hypothetical protein ANCCAN_06906 [Ancylostoma caninum]
MLGYEWKEVQNGQAEEGNESSLHIGLGNSSEEREEALAILWRERMDWRTDLFKALQKALRDVRSYKYEIKDGKGMWVANDHNAKRTGYDLPNKDVNNYEVTNIF